MEPRHLGCYVKERFLLLEIGLFLYFPSMQLSAPRWRIILISVVLLFGVAIAMVSVTNKKIPDPLYKGEPFSKIFYAPLQVHTPDEFDKLSAAVTTAANSLGEEILP